MTGGKTEPIQVTRRGRHPEADDRSEEQAIIVGFDAEWVDASHEDHDLPPDTSNRILSWQLFLLNPNTGRSCGIFVEPKSAHKASRKLLKTLIGQVVSKALKGGVLNRIPSRVILAAHFTRADLSTLRDFTNIKRKVDAVRTTYATTTKPLFVRIPTDQGEAPASVRIVDTMLLSPSHSQLAALGEALGLPKIELPDGFSKERMDLFLAADRNSFITYAMTDAKIAARWTARVLKIVREEMGVRRPCPTLGAVAVEMLRHEIEAAGLNVSAFEGRRRGKKGGKPQPLPNLVGKWNFAAQCYHGGRNEAVSVGYSPEEREIYDLDLTSAYTTALAMIREPNWSTARYTTNIAELATVEAAMTFALVKFRFPPETRIPSLPVRASNLRGLIYPIAGESWCTGPEMVVALAQGASLEAKEGLRIDWIENSPRVFEAFTRKINAVRAAAKEGGDTVLDQTAKEVGNSGYGKVAQGVAGLKTIADDIHPRRIFNSRSERMQDLGESGITQPMMASYTTGLVRAAVSEALAAMGPDEWLGTVTTDGFLTTVPVERVDQTGVVARAFVAARARITPQNPAIWEEKHREQSVSVIKTRGTVSCTPEAQKPILAKAGHKLEGKFATRAEEARAFMDLIRSRDYDTRLRTKGLISLRQQHLNEADLTTVTRNVRANLDFDFKRKIVNPRDVDGLLTANTTPWQAIEEFEEARDGLEAWKKSTRSVLKTVADYQAMTVWLEGADAHRAAGTKIGNRLGPLTSAVLKIAALGELGMRRVPDAELAAHMIKLCGVAVSTTKVWNARRRGKTAFEMLGTFTKVGEADKAFLARLYRTYPLMLRHVILRLLAPGSEALRQLDKLMIEEDERELERAHREWLDDDDGWFFAEECFITGSKEANSASVGQVTNPGEAKDLDLWSGAASFGSVACAIMDPIGRPTATDRVVSDTAT